MELSEAVSREPPCRPLESLGLVTFNVLLLFVGSGRTDVFFGQKLRRWKIPSIKLQPSSLSTEHLVISSLTISFFQARPLKGW